MAKYRVETKSFIDGRLCEVGEVVEYEGEAGSNLKLIEEPKRSGKADKSDKGESQDENA